jgi:hypothetical protein
MKLFQLLLLLLTCDFANAQVDETKNFLYFYSGSVVYSKSIVYKTPIFKKYYFLADSVKIDPDEVKFYKSDSTFYANIKALSYSENSTFVTRIRKGKLNLYEETATGYSAPMIAPNGMMMGGYGYSYTLDFYNKDYGEIKKATYKNLVTDISDNQASLYHLNKFKHARNTAAVLYTIGGITFITGVITLIHKTSNIPKGENQNPDVSGNILTMGAGAGCMLAGYIFLLSKPHHLKRAVEEYNK